MSVRRSLWLGSLITLFILLSAIPIAFAQETDDTTAAATAPTAVVDVAALYVRSGPGVGNSSIAVVYRGDTVNMWARNEYSNWIKVTTSSGTTGWVSSLRLFPSVPFQTLPVSEVEVLDNSAAVNSINANVRSGSAPNYSVIAVVSLGQRVGVLGRNNDSSWLKIRTPDGTEGWIYTALLDVQLDIPSLPFLRSPQLTTSHDFVATASVDGLRLRAGPGADYDVVTTVPQGGLLGLTGRNSDSSWIRVRLGNSSGWVASYLIQPSTPYSALEVVSGGTTAAATTTATTVITAADSSVSLGTATVHADALNMRSGPGLGYTVVGALGYANRVDMLGRSADNGWVKIRNNGQTAWISSDYIYTSVYVYTLPVVN